MAYIGNSPGVASQRVVTTFTATSGQTTFTPSSGYTLGYCDVFYNGVKLVDGDDYTAANGVNVVLATGAAAGDSVEIVAHFPRGLSDGYTQAEANARYAQRSNNLSDLSSASTARTNLGIGNVENKSSATIRSELTSGNVTGALGYTPVNKAGDTVTGKIVVEGNSQAWNSTTPGTATGSFHLDPQGGSASNHFGSAITFGAWDASNGSPAQAGIYTNTDGTYGTQLFIGTTDNYVQGTNKVGFAMDHMGRVTHPYTPYICGTPHTGIGGSSGFADRFFARSSNGLSFSNSRITVPIGGVYLISFQTICASGTGRIDTTIRINGVVVSSGLSEDNGSGFHQRTHVLSIRLSANDFIQFTNNSWYNNVTTFDEWVVASVTLIG